VSSKGEASDIFGAKPGNQVPSVPGLDSRFQGR
jgi:hypothetical protein